MVGLVSYGCLKLKKFEHEERFAKLQLIDWKVTLWVEATKSHREVRICRSMTPPGLTSRS